MEDYQNLNVRVPREVLLMVREIKRSIQLPREDVIIKAIRDLHATACKTSDKDQKKISVTKPKTL